MALSTLSSVLNGAVGIALIHAGKRYRSATLEADGHHLLTDVWTSVGVLVGIAAVFLTGWWWLDPVVALAVGINILWTGYSLLRDSVSSLLSEALPDDERQNIRQLLVRLEQEHSVNFTDRRTVASGRQRLVYLTMEVPGSGASCTLTRLQTQWKLPSTSFTQAAVRSFMWNQPAWKIGVRTYSAKT